jgi:hypothetical protein
MSDDDAPRIDAAAPGSPAAIHDQSGVLRARLEALASAIATSEESLADAYEESARLRPHAAERLRAAAREARAYAARERQYRTPPDPAAKQAPGS